MPQCLTSTPIRHQDQEGSVPEAACPRRACLYNVMPVPMTGWRADALNYAFMEPLRPRSTVYVIRHLDGFPWCHVW